MCLESSSHCAQQILTVTQKWLAGRSIHAFLENEIGGIPAYRHAKVLCGQQFWHDWNIIMKRLHIQIHLHKPLEYILTIHSCTYTSECHFVSSHVGDSTEKDPISLFRSSLSAKRSVTPIFPLCVAPGKGDGGRVFKRGFLRWFLTIDFNVWRLENSNLHVSMKAKVLVGFKIYIGGCLTRLGLSTTHHCLISRPMARRAPYSCFSNKDYALSFQLLVFKQKCRIMRLWESIAGAQTEAIH